MASKAGMKYAIIFAIVITVFSFSKCYRFIAYDEAVGGFKQLYCSISFFHFIPRSFSVLDFFVHLFVWIVISIVGYRVYMRYLGGKIF